MWRSTSRGRTSRHRWPRAPLGDAIRFLSFGEVFKGLFTLYAEGSDTLCCGSVVLLPILPLRIRFTPERLDPFLPARALRSSFHLGRVARLVNHWMIGAVRIARGGGAALGLTDVGAQRNSGAGVSGRDV